MNRDGFPEVDYSKPAPKPEAARYRVSVPLDIDPEDVARLALLVNLPPLTIEMARRLLIARGIEQPTAQQIVDLAADYAARAIASSPAAFRAPETRQQRRARERAEAKLRNRQPSPRAKKRSRIDRRLRAKKAAAR